jgi:hypothetical protein
VEPLHVVTRFDELQVALGWSFDPLTTLMLLLICTISCANLCYMSCCVLELDTVQLDLLDPRRSARSAVLWDSETPDMQLLCQGIEIAGQALHTLRPHQLRQFGRVFTLFPCAGETCRDHKHILFTVTRWKSLILIYLTLSDIIWHYLMIADDSWW